MTIKTHVLLANHIMRLSNVTEILVKVIWQQIVFGNLKLIQSCQYHFLKPIGKHSFDPFLSVNSLNIRNTALTMIQN